MRKSFFGIPALAVAATLVSAAPTLAQEWSFTDGAGNTITLESPPERIVAFSSSAAGLMQFGIEPVGIFVDDSASEKSYAEFDLEGIEVIRTAWNEHQTESLLALQPDLIVTEYWPRTGDYSGGTEMHPEGNFADVAPIVGVVQGDSVLGIIESYGELAEALGADLDSAEIVAQRDAFEAAREAFAAAAAAKPDLKVMAAWADPSTFMVATPDGAAELNDFKTWGLNVVEPEVAEGDYWATLSWETADTYPADVLILDDRSGSGPREAVEAQPLADIIPAVAAGQIGDWPAWWIRTHSAYAAELKELTALIETSEVVTE